MIAVTFALPAESRDFIRRIAGRPNAAVVTAGSIGNKAVEVLHTGVGCAIAERRLRKYLEQSTPDFVIAAGFAGATMRGCSIGDVILASNRSDSALLAAAEKRSDSFQASQRESFHCAGNGRFTDRPRRTLVERAGDCDRHGNRGDRDHLSRTRASPPVAPGVERHS